MSEAFASVRARWLEPVRKPPVLSLYAQRATLPGGKFSDRLLIRAAALASVVRVTAAASLILGLPPVAPEAAAEDWEGPKLKPVAREEVFEFARKPGFKKVGKDRYEITFASKGRCDVAVAIEDGAGRIVRHLVAGVLGPNAPEPLRPDSLEQTVIWDGKDDFGKYVEDPDRCVARVGLGLDPAFDKLLCWHPKDVMNTRFVSTIAADRDGVYVLECCTFNRLRVFDHDGNYVRTLWPPAGNLIESKDLDIPKKKVEYTGRVVPQLCGMGGVEHLGAVGDANCMAAAAGKLAFFTTGAHSLGNERHLLRMRTDGTTGGEPMVGAVFRKGYRSCTGTAHIALSPDGKWVYVSGLNRGQKHADHNERGPYYWNTVFRFGWDEKGPILEKGPFVGEVGRDMKAGTGAGDDERRLNFPEGIACDAQGRLYVCDSLNNRLQVYATDGPEGKLIKSIPVQQPQEVAVHQKTGEIYLLCFGRLRGDRRYEKLKEFKLLKLGPLDNPGVRVERKFTPPGDVHGFDPLLCVDSWSAPARVWLLVAPGHIQIWNDRGSDVELYQDFREEVAKAGLRPNAFGGYGFNHLAVDPIRGHVYYGRGLWARLDPEGPGKLVPVKLPPAPGMGWQDVTFDYNGLVYVRALTCLARFDPAKAVERESGIEFPFEAEVPFDYGEEQKLPWSARPLRGVIKIAAMPGANSFDNGICVSPRGEIAAFMKNYQDWKTAKEMAVEYVEMPPMEEDRYRPKIFEGRFWTFGELVMRWNKGGEMTGEDLVPALPSASCGIRLDRNGNIYVGIGANMYMADGKRHLAGTLAKFPPTGGKVYGKGDMAKLKELPKRPPEMWTYGWGDLWTKNCYWLYPGLDQVHFLGNPYPCLCATCRFDMDLYARCFVPKAYQFTVGVVDTNGNPICDIGRYGNADTRGPKDSTVKIGGPEIAIAHCSYLTVLSDRWLYICDDGNGRIIRVKLGYKAEERAGIQ